MWIDNIMWIIPHIQSEIFYKILSVLENIVIDLNNGMLAYIMESDMIY